MKGLHFINDNTPSPSSVERMDIACFVGFVNFRGSGVIPHSIDTWLQQAGWRNRDYGEAIYHRESSSQLRDVPIPIESWEMFDQLFEWEKRPLSDQLSCATWLGVAVRAFFAQGGRKCYVINAGEPFDYSAPNAIRVTRISELIPGFGGTSGAANRNDRSTWHGIGLLFGLPEVSYLSVPDLVDLFRSDTALVETDIPAAPEVPEEFVECSDNAAEVIVDRSLEGIAPPRYSDSDYADWRAAVGEITQFLSDHRREVHFVASIPLPSENSMVARDLLLQLHQPDWLDATTATAVNRIGSAFTQLNYPWIKPRHGSLSPSNLEPGEGSLIGLLANNALVRGCYRSAVPLRQNHIIDLEPKLPLSQMSDLRSVRGISNRLEERVSLWQLTRDSGVGLRSDVTTSPNAFYRNASVSRTMAMILRYARHLGEELLFANNGETLWRQIRDRVSGFLNQLYNLGVLDGKSQEEAYSVRCDRSIMSQQDLDSGVVRVEVVVNITASLETILVSFSVQSNGETQLTLGGVA